MDSNPRQHRRKGCCSIRCSNSKALLAHLESIWNHWHPLEVPYSTNQYFFGAHSITNLLSNLIVRGGHCSWSWEAATVLDHERRPTYLMVRGGHRGWSWEAATIFNCLVDCERRPPFLLTKLIERGGHQSWLWEAATVRFSNFLKIHYIKWHKIWFTLLYTLPYQPREVAASRDNFSGSGCTYSAWGHISYRWW